MTTLFRLLRDRRIATQRAEAIQRALDVASATATEPPTAPEKRTDKLAADAVPAPADLT